MPLNIGPMEVVVVLLIALIILGPKRLPDAGRALGSGLRNFKRELAAEPPPATEDRPGDGSESAAVAGQLDPAGLAPIPHQHSGSAPGWLINCHQAAYRSSADLEGSSIASANRE